MISPRFLLFLLLLGFGSITTANAAPQLLQPTPNSTFSGASEFFQWTANGTAVTHWYLSFGTTQGAYDIADLDQGSSLSTTFNGLPTDGSTVWVRLWFKVGGSWSGQNYQYTAANLSTGQPVLLTPTPGSTFSSASAFFQWTANGTAVTRWYLSFGTTQGAYDIADLSQGSSLSTTFNGLPTDGSTVWVRLSYKVGGSWFSLDYQYTAHNQVSNGVSMVSPTENGFMDAIDVTAEATATGFPQDWSVVFVLDGAYGSPIAGTFDPPNSVWRASLGDLSRQAHTVAAVMVDGSGTQYTGFTDDVTFDVGDYYVAFGDSISEGIGDDVSGDNQSSDGRNNHTGYAPILNDLLTQAKGYPHSVAVQGIPGYTAGDALSEIGSALAAHPEARYFLIQFGTNDSNPAAPVPSGLNLEPGDAGYPGTFKHNMQQLIDAVNAVGKVPLLAKAPIRYGNCSSSAGCLSYVQLGIAPQSATANGYVRNFNAVVDELIESNGLVLDPSAVPTVPLVAPDLYGYFESTGLDGQGKSPLFFDWLHPNGTGYPQMAQRWSESLTNAVAPSFSPELLVPAPGSTFSGASQYFEWTANGGTPVTRWYLSFGTTQGAFDIADLDQGTSLSTTVNGLPTGGSTVWVRLWYKVGGSWLGKDYQYTAAP